MAEWFADQQYAQKELWWDALGVTDGYVPVQLSLRPLTPDSDLISSSDSDSDDVLSIYCAHRAPSFRKKTLVKADSLPDDEACDSSESDQDLAADGSQTSLPRYTRFPDDDKPEDSGTGSPPGHDTSLGKHEKLHDENLPPQSEHVQRRNEVHLASIVRIL